ncbi:enoyl-CoA hydratase [Choiromyces venosus 120613-1]|uniref:Enoyl-CoA hydratase n=1 Tax=Choiromyces venosus 120613-1 TaxID=1336337 RepID=A0A3N4JZI7_9PEZI|nr:enoyl-CoA hydratase [Choiromyces venosus 120613-1]
MFRTPPPPAKSLILTFPTPHILVVTINRPQAMNCINSQTHHEMSQVWHWYDEEPSLRCAVVTGSPHGKRRAFCAGQDLKEWNDVQSGDGDPRPAHAEGGFGGLSRRSGKKPVIAAVDGLALGGGMEMLVNADIVVASVSSMLGLPEVKRGVVAFAGALPRLAMSVGLQRASELALTGRMLNAGEAREWGLVNKVVGDGEGEVLAATVAVAKEIAGNSPDSVIVSRAGVRSAWEGESVEEATKRVREGVGMGLETGENIKEGLRAFVEKREPKWVDSKL